MSETLPNLLQENRQFPPPPGLAAAANVKADANDAAAIDEIKRIAVKQLRMIAVGVSGWRSDG